MCTLVMDPSHGTLDIFHFEEVIYIFSNIFEMTNWMDVSQWKQNYFSETPVGLVILKLKYLLL